MSSKQDVLVIGAGLAGLAAGISACRNGYSTRIVERHSLPGGVAATWQRGPYTFEGGMHFLMGYRPGNPLYALYQEVGLFPGLEVVALDPYLEFIDGESGRSIELVGDLDVLRGKLLALAPKDASLIDGLIAGARRMAGSDFGMASMTKAPSLMNPIDGLRMLWEMRNYARDYVGPSARPMAEFAKSAGSPLLRRILENLFLPEVPAWFVMMVLALASEGQLGLLPRGSLDFAQRMAARFEALGGKFSYGTEVTEVLVEGGCAHGLRLADGSELRADTVIAACDLHLLHYELLHGRFIDRATRQRFETWPLIRPLITVHFGLRRQFPGEAAFSIEVLDEPLCAGGEEFRAVSLRRFNYSPSFAPEGSSVIELLLETHWDRWEALGRDARAYRDAKAEVAALALSYLERLYPGISATVEESDVATPLTLNRYTRNWRGSYEGWMPDAMTILKVIPRSIPGLSNLYLAGQWVVPGGGVPTSMYSGLHAVQMICARDRRRWVGPA